MRNTGKTNMWVPELTREKGPAYKAIADAIALAIANGQLASGARLPTHRALADALGVTVGTVTRGYAEAERRNLVHARVGSGTFVRGAVGAAKSFFIGDQGSQNDSTIDLCFSIPLEINQEQMLAATLREIEGEAKLLQRLLRYHPEYGMRHHREAGKRWLEITGIRDVDAQRVIISNGGQHGFFLALLTLCRSGDTVLCDGLTYPGFIIAARQLGLRVVGLDMDCEGVTPQALQLACQRYQPRLIYLMPRLHNPTSRRMSQERMAEVAQLCRRHQVTILEDDIQSCMADKTQPVFVNLAPDISLLVTGCSKAMTGGLRVGFIYAGTEELFNLIANGLKVTSWMIPPLMVEIASRWIVSGQAEAMLRQQREELTYRHRMVAETLAGYSYEAVITAFNVWLHLPEQWRAAAFAERVAEKQVLIKPAEVFAAGQYPAPQAVRLCLGGDLSRTKLQEGLNRLLAVMTELPGGGPGFAG